MSRILNLRGASGAGKTTVVYDLMAKSSCVDKLFSPITGKPEAYRAHGIVSEPVVFIGRYESACGGCDSINSQDEICDRVRKYVGSGIVFFEGLLISGLYSRYAALSSELGGILFAFLDTPDNVMIDRVITRREARGVPRDKPFKTDNIIAKHVAADRTKEKFERDGHRTIWIDYRHATEQVLGILHQMADGRYDR